jgi:Ca-activated chloride channel homolog
MKQITKNQPRIKRIALMALLMLTLGGRNNAQSSVHHGELTANGSLYFRAEPLNNFITDKTGDVYYYVHLQGSEKTGTAKKHIPLNLSLVVDRSGSMEGEKLKYTKEAVKYVVNNLHSSDVLSIVTYESGVEVLLEPQRVEDKPALIKKIEAIVTAGSTNMEGGLRKGYELVKNTKKLMGDEMISRVILLSDGLANVGMSDPAQLSALTRDFFEKDHISITTFGVGNDYNEDLMAKVALQGGGKYYFISSPEQLPKLFEEELNGMSQVVGKKTQVKIRFPDELSYERTYAYNSTKNGNELTISFNDIFAKEQKSLLVAFKVKGRPKAPFTITCELEYQNSSSDSLYQVKDSRVSEIRFTKDEKEYDSGFNRPAGEGYALEVTAELFEQAVHLSDAEHYEEAKKKINQAKNILDNHFKNMGENTFLRDFEKQLTEYLVLIDDMKTMDRETVKLNIKFRKQKHFRSVSCPRF